MIGTELLLALEELRGWPVVINFRASWCIPCREKAPLLTASSRAHRSEVGQISRRTLEQGIAAIIRPR